MPWISLRTTSCQSICSTCNVRVTLQRTHVVLRAFYAPQCPNAPRRRSASLIAPKTSPLADSHAPKSLLLSFRPSNSLSWHWNRLHHIMPHKRRVDLHHSLRLRQLWPPHHPLHLLPILLPQLHYPQPYLPRPCKRRLSSGRFPQKSVRASLHDA